jgi:hypothetical protein
MRVALDVPSHQVQCASCSLCCSPPYCPHDAALLLLGIAVCAPAVFLPELGCVVFACIIVTGVLDALKALHAKNAELGTVQCLIPALAALPAPEVRFYVATHLSPVALRCRRLPVWL